MCGGYGFHGGGWQELRLTFELHEIDRAVTVDETAPITHYAIRPFQPAPIIRASQSGARRASWADQWSLLPPWSKTRRVKYSTFNARNDKLQSAATWRVPFRRKRCLVPATGFFERVPEEGSSKKRPYYVTPKAGHPFCFAGLWDEWIDRASGEVVTSYAVITSPPNALMKKIGHHRAPAILESTDFDAWLDPNYSDMDALSSLLESTWSSDAWHAWKVDYSINLPRERGANVMNPIGDPVSG